VATIQVRDVPEESYEVLRRRARTSGRSMQAYMREELIAWAARPTKQEALDDIDAYHAENPGQHVSSEEILADLAADRR
jgi:plasmid stability protein